MFALCLCSGVIQNTMGCISTYTSSTVFPRGATHPRCAVLMVSHLVKTYLVRRCSLNRHQVILHILIAPCLLGFDVLVNIILLPYHQTFCIHWISHLYIYVLVSTLKNVVVVHRVLVLICIVLFIELVCTTYWSICVVLSWCLLISLLRFWRKSLVIQHAC
jgi:hypothetical protein